VAAATLVLAITATASGGGDAHGDSQASTYERGESARHVTSGVPSAAGSMSAPESSGTAVSAKEPQVRVEVAGIRTSAVPDSCPATRALRFYRAREREWLTKMGAGDKDSSPAGIVQRTPACPRYLAKVAQTRARAARRAWERFRTLRDFPIRPGVNAWLRAVEEAQRPYPGSRAWLRSCSAAEGGWGRWVVHGGGSYYSGAEYVDVSSGHLQYRYSTFRGHYRRALDDLRTRGFRVPEHLQEVSVTAWRSALGQALAGGWGILHGQRSHWYASYGRGC